MPLPEGLQIEAPISAKERAKEYICGWIIDGTLKPGEKINDAEIARLLGVSRTPVREALQSLGQQGFVVMKPGVATFVNDINPNEVFMLLPPLAVLQELATATAAEYITEEDIEYLSFVNEGFKKAIEKEDYFNALKKDEDFHRRIVRLCNNKYIDKIVVEYQAHVRRFFYANAIKLTINSYEQHKQIIELLDKKDSRQAGKIARANWEYTLEINDI